MTTLINNLVKSLVADFVEDATAYGYEFEPEDTAVVASLVIDTLDRVRKSANVPDEQLASFVEQNDRLIRAEALNSLDGWYEGQMIEKSMSELSYHPEHVRAHKIEDEDGKVWDEGFVKGRFTDLPEELRSHLLDYHGESKVYHVHLDSGNSPMIFGRDAEVHSMNPAELKKSQMHEIIHRLDERAFREINGLESTSAEDWELEFYQEFNKAEIYPNMIWADGVVIAPELAGHLNDFHGSYPNGELKYVPHPLEVTMIGPSEVFSQLSEMQKALSDRVPEIKETTVVDELRTLFTVPDETIQRPKVENIYKALGLRPFHKAGVETEDEANLGGDYSEPEAPPAEPTEKMPYVNSQESGLPEEELALPQAKPQGSTNMTTVADNYQNDPNIRNYVLEHFMNEFINQVKQERPEVRGAFDITVPEKKQIVSKLMQLNQIITGNKGNSTAVQAGMNASVEEYIRESLINYASMNFGEEAGDSLRLLSQNGDFLSLMANVIGNGTLPVGQEGKEDQPWPGKKQDFLVNPSGGKEKKPDSEAKKPASKPKKPKAEEPSTEDREPSDEELKTIEHQESSPVKKGIQPLKKNITPITGKITPIYGRDDGVQNRTYQADDIKNQIYQDAGNTLIGSGIAQHLGMQPGTRPVENIGNIATRLITNKNAQNAVKDLESINAQGNHPLSTKSGELGVSNMPLPDEVGGDYLNKINQINEENGLPKNKLAAGDGKPKETEEERAARIEEDNKMIKNAPPQEIKPKLEGRTIGWKGTPTTFGKGTQDPF
jgi:hypothetical protein